MCIRDSSKVVAALGSTSRALGILGGSTGQMISEALSGLNMTCDFLPVEGNTRINLKVVDPIAHTSTEINEPGVPVDPATLQSLLDHLLKLLRHDDIVVLAGSLPVNAPADKMCIRDRYLGIRRPRVSLVVFLVRM